MYIPNGRASCFLLPGVWNWFGFLVNGRRGRRPSINCSIHTNRGGPTSSAAKKMACARGVNRTKPCGCEAVWRKRPLAKLKSRADARATSHPLSARAFLQPTCGSACLPFPRICGDPRCWSGNATRSQAGRGIPRDSGPGHWCSMPHTLLRYGTYSENVLCSLYFGSREN